MAIHIPRPSRWSAKHWILVTLIGTLVAIAIVAVISISLSPARIHFSILSASINKSTTNKDQYYNFTLVANNTSRRTAVRYVALSAEIWYSWTGWVPTDVCNTSWLPSEWQPGRYATNIPFSADYWQYDVPKTTSNTMVSNGDWPNTTVVVIAKVLFKFGLAQTRPYNVRASCKPVNFFVNSTNTIFPVKCTDG